MTFPYILIVSTDVRSSKLEWVLVHIVNMMLVVDKIRARKVDLRRVILLQVNKAKSHVPTILPFKFDWECYPIPGRYLANNLGKGRIC